MLFLLACTDPGAVAVAACEAVPVLSPDAASIGLLTPLITAKELESVAGAEPTAGFSAVGAEGMAELRAGTICVVESVDGAGSGAWAVSMVRTQPVVNADGTLGAPVETAISWQVTSAEGGRAEPGLPKAVAMRKSIEEARAEGDLRRAASTLRALSSSFPDPTLAVDVALAEAAEADADAEKEAAKLAAQGDSEK